MSGPGEEAPRAESPGRRGKEVDDRSTWIESRQGLLFFANAVLVAPELFVLLPLTLRALLDPLVLHGRPSAMLDTIPEVAAHVLPWVGWLLAIPLALTSYNLRLEERRWPSAVLKLFLVIHIGFVAYTIGRWVGG